MVHVSTVTPHTADLGTDKKAVVFGNRRYWESYNITYKTLIWDLEMGGGIGGGGIGRGGIGRGGIGGGGGDCSYKQRSVSCQGPKYTMRLMKNLPFSQNIRVVKGS